MVFLEVRLQSVEENSARKKREWRGILVGLTKNERFMSGVFMDI